MISIICSLLRLSSWLVTLANAVGMYSKIRMCMRGSELCIYVYIIWTTHCQGPPLSFSSEFLFVCSIIYSFNVGRVVAIFYYVRICPFTLFVLSVFAFMYFAAMFLVYVCLEMFYFLGNWILLTTRTAVNISSLFIRSQLDLILKSILFHYL